MGSPVRGPIQSVILKSVGTRQLHMSPAKYLVSSFIDQIQLVIESDPFKHTFGRWLRLDAEQREARRVTFNIDQLCKKVLSLCPSAISIQSCQKLEGGFSKAFVITTDDGKRLVAKFPTSVAGPAGLVTNSEVATISYCMLWNGQLLPCSY